MLCMSRVGSWAATSESIALRLDGLGRVCTFCDLMEGCEVVLVAVLASGFQSNGRPPMGPFE